MSSAARWCFKGAEWLGARIGDAIIACGHEEYTLSRHLAGHKLVVCIPNALPLNALDSLRAAHSAAQFPPNARPKVGICGRLARERNPELFAAIANALRNEADWYWIGAPHPVPDAENALPAHVNRTGWLHRADAIKMLAELDIYVHTSQWDGLSYAVLEAMAVGKAVVATDIPANRAIIEHGHTGFLGNTRKDMTKLVRRLLQDVSLRQATGAAARSYIERQHDATQTYQAYTQMYAHLLKDRM